ncbi:MAG: hypothetical protein Fur0032_14930 [Terrimicrobiaceae bacterium]
MRKSLWFGLLAFGMVSPLGAQQSREPKPKPKPVPLQRTTSSSQQFIIYGGTPKFRVELARRADDLAKDWSRATGVSEPWKWPVIIQLVPAAEKRSARPRLSLFVGDGDTVKIQVDAPDSIRRPSDLDIEILSALTLEAAYRGASPVAGRPYTQPPAWIAEAVWQTIAAGEDGVPAALFGKLVESGPPPKLESFLKQRPSNMDATSRAVYRAQAYALLQALTATPEGHKGLAGYIARMRYAKAEDIRPLMESFPSLADNRAELVKLWTLSLAGASAPRRLESLSSEETEQQLANLLDSLQTEPKSNSSAVLTGSAALPELARDKEGRFRISKIAEELLRLEARSHLLYRPVVSEYRAVASELAIKPRKDAARRLAAADELRSALSTKMSTLTDYLNWFEVVKQETLSESFADGSNPLAPADIPRRSDPISVALDSAEARLTK